MEPSDKLRLAVSDHINEVDVGPKHVPLDLLGEFQRDVSDFLQGSSKEVDPGDVLVSIEEGSLVFVVAGLLAASGLWHDLESMTLAQSLANADGRRAAVVQRWMNRARNNPSRTYRLEDSQKRVLVIVDKTTEFKFPEQVWVKVEKYLHGQVVDWGGKTRPNVHLVLDNGRSVTIASTQELLGQEKENRLYRSSLLHVTGEENLETGEIRNLNLLAFETHKPAYDQKEFDQMVQKGTHAWADVSNATEWLENLRGNKV